MSYFYGTVVHISDSRGEGFAADVQETIWVAVKQLCENTRDRFSPFSEFEPRLGAVGTDGSLLLRLSGYVDEEDASTRELEDATLAREFCLELGLLIGSRYEFEVERDSDF